MADLNDEKIILTVFSTVIRWIQLCDKKESDIR